MNPPVRKHGVSFTRSYRNKSPKYMCRKVYMYSIVSAPSVLKFSKKKAREIEKLLPILEFFISSTGF